MLKTTCNFPLKPIYDVAKYTISIVEYNHRMILVPWQSPEIVLVGLEINLPILHIEPVWMRKSVG